MGDGWLSTPIDRNKWIIGLCGNLKLDKKYIKYLISNVNELFNRKGFITHNEKGNSITFLFRHRLLFEFLTENMRFPIGKKKFLIINKKIYILGFEKIRYLLRGIFDTDGTFYLGKNRKGIPSFPIIAIHMNQFELIKQIGDILINEGFKINYSDHGKMIRVHGKDQLKKWMNLIGSSNPKHINKIEKFLNSIN